MVPLQQPPDRPKRTADGKLPRDDFSFLGNNLHTPHGRRLLLLADWASDKVSFLVVHSLYDIKQYTSFRFTQHLIDSGVEASIGTVGDALDNALAESLIGLYKTELIKPRGPWHTIGEVDVATAAWVEWYNNCRLRGACGGRPPVEFEILYELGDLISLVA